jgi:hypothetical protein
MKIPFRYQTTEYDCVPTTFINALQYLFDRDEIPPEAIQKIMQYSLDTVTVNKKGEYGKGDGTTRLAIQMILQWLEYHTEGKFAFKRCEYMDKAQIHLGRNNKIISCINRGGIALMNVCSGSDYHYLLALGLDENDSGKLLFFDPYYQERKCVGDDSAHIEWLGNNGGQKANLRVSRERLDSYDWEEYSMGSIEERECCLLERL